MARLISYRPLHRVAFFVVLLLLLHGNSVGQTSVYNKYASNTNIKVACVNNFVLDSGITTDVTVLEALDDEGWGWMRNEFSIGSLAPEQRQDLENGQDVFMFTQRDVNNLRNNVSVSGEVADIEHCCYLGVSYLSRRIFVFSCSSEKQKNAIVAYMIEKVMRNK